MPATIWVDNVRSQPIFFYFEVFFQIYWFSWDQKQKDHLTVPFDFGSSGGDAKGKLHASRPRVLLNIRKDNESVLWVTIPGYCVSSPPGTLWPGSLPWRNPSKRSWLRGSASGGQPPYSHSPLCYRPWRSEEMLLRSHEVCSLYQFKYRR